MMRVALERFHELTGIGVENLGEFVRTAGSQVLAVRGKIEAEHRVAVRIFQFSDQFAIGHIPDFDFAAAGRHAAAGGKPLAIGTEFHRQHAIDQWRILIACPDGSFVRPFRVQIPNLDFSVAGHGNKLAVRNESRPKNRGG
jgi:hypothetical protein